jgi:sugar lactone lactonase YvrE
MALQVDTLYIASPTTGAVLTLSLLTGAVTELVALGLAFPHGVGFGPGGTLYVTELSSGEVSAVNIAQRTVTTVAQGLSSPTDLAFDGSGNMYVAQNGAGVITRISAGFDGQFGTADDVRVNVASGLTSAFGLEILGDQLYFTVTSPDNTLSALNLQTLQISLVANLPEVGRWVAVAPVPEPSVFGFAATGLIGVAFYRYRKSRVA